MNKMAEEPENKKRVEIKVMKFSEKADLNIEQWLKLVDIKRKQLKMNTDDLIDQLIDLLEGEAPIF